MADHLVAGLHCADAADLAASFVLGALDTAESDAVRAHLAGCPEAHAEFAELGSVVPALFETVDVVQPPSALRSRILAAAAADMQVAGADTQVALSDTQVAAADAGRAAPRPIEIPRLADTQRNGWAPSLFRRPVWAAVAMAAAIAALALGAWNLQLRDEINGLNTYRDGVAAVLDQAKGPGAQLAVLADSTAGGPTGLAVVTNGGTGVSLVMRDLAPTTGSEVYEAWLIAGENAPVPIGSFQVNASGVATFTATGPGDLPALTVALTREPGPGAKTPTLPIVAAGTAS